MEENWQQGITSLLANTHIGFLATQGEQTPETSMAPYTIFQGDVVLHLSSLAKHSKNIKKNAHVGFMICSPETTADSPLALARLSFTGILQAVPEQDKQGYQQAYLANIPDAAPLFSFPDFTLYRLNTQSIFWVGGFGQARTVSKQTWETLCSK